jgi:hypothetical protein
MNRNFTFAFVIWGAWCGLNVSQFQVLLLLVAGVFFVRWLMRWIGDRK